MRMFGDKNKYHSRMTCTAQTQKRTNAHTEKRHNVQTQMILDGIVTQPTNTKAIATLENCQPVSRHLELYIVKIHFLVLCKIPK